jgi:hypothetical protein
VGTRETFQKALGPGSRVGRALLRRR